MWLHSQVEPPEGTKVVIAAYPAHDSQTPPSMVAPLGDVQSPPTSLDVTSPREPQGMLTEVQSHVGSLVNPTAVWNRHEELVKLFHENLTLCNEKITKRVEHGKNTRNTLNRRSRSRSTSHSHSRSSSRKRRRSLSRSRSRSGGYTYLCDWMRCSPMP